MSILEQTFIHVEGIGHKTERRLWERGFRTWKDFLDHRGMVFTPGRDKAVRGVLKESLQNRHDPGWFYERLPNQETWRLFGDFGQKAAYLDIETAGLDFGMDEITVIGLHGNGKSQSFVAGFNMEGFEAAVAEFEMLVTFNGLTFDVPFIRRAFPNIWLPKAHIDLRYVLRKIGFSGGLKKIEHETGISRSAEIDGLSGLDAVYLWRNWQNGDKDSLERLVAYNMADTENLKPLMKMAFSRLMQRDFPETASKTAILDEPVRPV